MGSQVLHNALAESGYANAAFGKWHLAGRGGNATHPNSFGIDHYEGNLQGNISDYYAWTKTTNGQESQDRTYHTSAMTAASSTWIQAQTKPWLAWVAYSAPHAPIHQPPSDLHSRVLAGDPNKDARNHYLVAIEAMDTEIGRLLSAIPRNELDDTVIVFIGDNGTPRRLIDQKVYSRAQGKSSLYEGGIRVPLIISGGDITGGQRRDNLVNIVDLFPTLSELAGNAASETDGISFAGLLNGGSVNDRSYNYAEYENGWAVRDRNFKFIRQTDRSEELYDLRQSHAETKNILGRADVTEQINQLRQYGLSIRGQILSTASVEPLSSFSNTSGNCADYAGNYTATGRDVARDISFNAQISIGATAQTCTFRSNSIPNHDFNDGSRAFPNDTAEVREAFTIVQNPVAATKPTPLSLRVDNAIMLNGVKVDVIGAGCHGIGNGKIGCNDMATPWRYDPMNAAAGFNVDRNNAHTQPDGAYHYHGPPPILTGNRNTPSGVIGFAADGFPIYGSWFKSGTSVKKAQSSYRLKSGMRPSGPGGVYDGRFRDDYEYVAGLGDLDECNGQTVNGQYGYYVSDGYPYIIGCFTGTPHASFTKSGGGQDQGADRSQRQRDGARRRGQRREGGDSQRPGERRLGGQGQGRRGDGSRESRPREDRPRGGN